MGKLTERGSWRRWWVHGLGCIAVLAGLAGCSLISLKSPEKPLTTQELNARILTREQTSQFLTAVERSAQSIVTTEQDQVCSRTHCAGSSRHCRRAAAPKRSSHR